MLFFHSITPLRKIVNPRVGLEPTTPTPLVKAGILPLNYRREKK